MSIGFRKSLLGYNPDDVIEYVRKLHASFSEKEAEFKAQISDLDEKINALTKKEITLEAEKNELNSKLTEFEGKRAEMERLSENIGKLYLVAQTNAKTIMSNAEKNSKVAYEETAKNVSAIEETHQALDSLRNSINETAQNFTNEISALMGSLEAAKAKLSDDAEINEIKAEEFSALLEAVSK